MTVLEAVDLAKTFTGGDGGLIPVLDGANLRVSRGEMVAIVGASGAGKSTLLHLLGALDRPTRGTVSIAGEQIEDRSDEELSILRNTIYARYGWDGYRKPWLRAYFHSQPWFKPNPKFTYKVLSDADRKNAHFIGTREQSLNTDDLTWMKADVSARHGKVWKTKILRDKVVFFAGPEAFSFFMNDDHFTRENGSPKFLQELLHPDAVPFLDGERHKIVIE